MTPIQTQALDLLSWLFIWAVRIIGWGMFLGAIFAAFGILITKT